MKILPKATLPPESPLAHRHTPTEVASYALHRPCLRWDFGFTCAFCLVHERDLQLGGLGAGRQVSMTIEHLEPQSRSPEDVGHYSNLTYACSMCNRARSISARIDADGRRLLDPTSDPWGSHFSRLGHRLSPIPGDRDAQYTHEAYALDDATKVEIRRARLDLIEDHVAALPAIAEAIDACARELARDSSRTPELLQHLAALERHLKRLWSDLERLQPIPPDAPERCRCDSPENRALPPAFEAQLVELQPIST